MSLLAAKAGGGGAGVPAALAVAPAPGGGGGAPAPADAKDTNDRVGALATKAPSLTPDQVRRSAAAGRAPGGGARGADCGGAARTARVHRSLCWSTWAWTRGGAWTRRRRTRRSARA